MSSIIRDLSIWIVVLPFLSGMWNLRRLSHPATIMLGAVILAIPPQLAATNVDIQAKNILFNMYTPLEFILLYFFFKDRFQGTMFKAITRASFILYTAISIYVVYSSGGIVGSFISNLVSLNNLIYLIWIVMLFYEIFTLDSFELSPNTAFFWALLAIFFYAACTPLHFMLYDTLKRSGWSAIQNGLNVLQYVFLAWYFVIDARAPDQFPPAKKVLFPAKPSYDARRST